MSKLRLILFLLTLAVTFNGRAQWVTQTFDLKSGWNAVYLHVDPSHLSISSMTETQPLVQEVWLWQPAPASLQFVTSPQQPTGTGSQWISWKRTDAVPVLTKMVGNAAYLVRVSGDYTWSIKGRPLAPSYGWTTTGLNFLGYPTVPANPPTFQKFFEQSPEVLQELQAFQYGGGNLGANNPRELASFLFSSKVLRRGEAFWLRSGNLFNRAYGPFEITLQGAGGVDFGDTIQTISLRLRNLHPSSHTVSLQLVTSESAPEGQPALHPITSLLVRAGLNLTNLSYGYTNLAVNARTSWVLAPKGQPGSEVEVVLGLNRHAMTNAPGALLGAIVRLTDSFGYSQIDLPLSATTASTAGLWIGQASVSSVNAYLKSYQKNAGGTPVVNANTGAYLQNTLTTNSGNVSQNFPLRLIVHNNASGNAVLLQRVFYGFNADTNPIITLRELNLDSTQLDSARRISAPHLPWTSGNSAYPFTGALQQGGILSSTVLVHYTDQASNPFLHAYHPDHDNLDATFKVPLAQGEESYSISRKITLEVSPPDNNFFSLSSSGLALMGNYSEEITYAGHGSETRTFKVSGRFNLKRISNIPTLIP